MANDFGALTDHFGIETSDLVLIESSKTQRPLSRDDSGEDENGDLAAATWFGNTAETLFDVSCTYELKANTLNLNTLYAGELDTGIFASSVQAVTGNKALPRIVLNGVLGATAIIAPTGFLNKFQLPDITLTAIKQAQLLDFTVDAACRLTGSELTANVNFYVFNDGLGEPHAFGCDGGVITMSADFVRITGACAWTTGTTWTETQPPAPTEPQAQRHTGKGAAEAILTRSASS